MRLNLQFFGGRGASSGRSVKGNVYGSQYHTVMQSDNIKFVENNKGITNREPLMETMTPGRIYVQVGGNDLLRIVQFDKDNKRYYTIEYDKRQKEWHTHAGYEHAEYGPMQHMPLTDADNDLLEKVKRLWKNRNRA